MKRIVPLLLSLLLMGCVASVAPVRPVLGETVSSATASPEPDDAAGADEGTKADGRGEAPFSYVPAPLMQYLFFDQPDWEDLTSAVMFSFDLDKDGEEEDISFALDRDNWNTAITWGDSTAILDESDELVSVSVLDLDPDSPFYNLLVTLDYGSDSYVTVELHPTDGALIKGAAIQGYWDWEEGALWFYERTDFLGTDEGKRTFHGDDLTPDSPWLTMCYIPTEEELADEEERELLIDGGILLHTILPVPCTIEGKPGLIPEDTYVYRTRFRADNEVTEVCLPNGTLAQIACTIGEHGWPYLIDGRDMVDCFDNLFFAD